MKHHSTRLKAMYLTCFLFNARILLHTANHFLCAARYSATNNLKLKFLFYYCLVLLLLIYMTLPDRAFDRADFNRSFYQNDSI